ncbi:MAG: DEAD/DEAH box helicase, partial [Bdellovibrionales bacterium]
VLDLLFHLPVDFIDRRFSPMIADAPNGRVATMAVTVTSHSAPSHRNAPYRVKVRDDSGVMTLVFFHANPHWVQKQLPDREQVIVSGKVEYYQGNAQMVHPDIAKPEDRAELETIEAVYPLTAGLTNKVVRKAVQGALGFVSALPEWLEPEYKKRQNWPDWDRAIAGAHAPESMEALLPEHPMRQRLAYDELLANQLTLSLVRLRQRKSSGRSLGGDGALRAKLRAVLPFALTGAQERSLVEIDADMRESARMMRLLQGDVGAGKTVVAAMAMLSAVECGAQAALLAPTEILARQHAETLKPWLDAIGVRFVTLTGRDKGAARDTLLGQIANGAAQIVIGTHAIFQD